MRSFLLWLYTTLLRLYPATFYQQFADEMTDTFALLLQDQPPLRVGLRELGALQLSILREHQRMNSLWYMLVLLMLPTLLGCVVLLSRPIQRFYLSPNLWLIFAGVSIAILLIGWLLERRITVLALPSLGFMLFIAQRVFPVQMFPDHDVSLAFNIAVPALLLTGVLKARRLNWKLWLPYLIALPLIGLIISLIVIEIQPSSILHPPLFRGFMLGGLLPAGTLSLLVLAGLPFAARHGSKAVLLIVGYLFFALLGLSATLPNLDLQQITGTGYMLLFLLVIPLLVLKLPRRANLSVLIAVAMAYGLIFLIKAVIAEMDATFFLYRTNELLQTLLALHLAMTVYARLERPVPDNPSVAAQAHLSQNGQVDGLL